MAAPRASLVMFGRTALVLCGGGSRGALEVGLYRALHELRIGIDFIIGSSVGAVNGALVAAGTSPAELARIWRSVRPRDVCAFNKRLLLRPLRSPALLDNRRLRAFLHRHLPVRRFDELRIPLTVTGTCLQTGEPLYFTEGDLVDALMASTAAPGLFPPLELPGCQVIDGGIANNVPLDVAIKLGADTIITILCICCDAIPYPVNSWRDILQYSLSIAIDRKFRADLQRLQDKVCLVVIEPRAGLEVGLLDFSHTDDLIALGYERAIAELKPRASPLRRAYRTGSTSSPRQWL